MQTRWWWVLALVFCGALAAAEGGARSGGGRPAGQPGGQRDERAIEFIIQNAADMALSAEQKAQFEALLKAQQSARELQRGDAELKALYKQQNDAARANDQATLKDVREKIRAREKEVTGADIPALRKAAFDSLSPDQRKKLVAAFDTAHIPVPPAVRAPLPGLGGPPDKLIQNILLHVADLKLTGEQQAQLGQLGKEVLSEAKFKIDPTAQDLAKQLKDARAAHDGPRTQELTEKLKAERAALGLPERPLELKRVLDVLTEEQRETLRGLVAPPKSVDAPAPPAPQP